MGIVVSRFNRQITDRLLLGALAGFKECGVSAKAIKTVEVPGAFEIPGVARLLCLSGRFHAVVCLGAVIRGETEHFTYISKAAQEGVLSCSVESGLPVVFGVLTTEDWAQALERSGGDGGNKGYDCALDAVELANTYALLS